MNKWKKEGSNFIFILLERTIHKPLKTKKALLQHSMIAWHSVSELGQELEYQITQFSYTIYTLNTTEWNKCTICSVQSFAQHMHTQSQHNNETTQRTLFNQLRMCCQFSSSRKAGYILKGEYFIESWNLDKWHLNIFWHLHLVRNMP